MKYSEKIYDNHKNIIRTSSDICFFKYPQYDMEGLNTPISGITSSSTNVFLIEDEMDIAANITFTSNLEYLDSEVEFNYSILPLNKTNQEFTTVGMFNSQVFPYTGVTQDTTFNTTQLLGEGEYLLKLAYQYPMCTEIAKAMGKRQVTTTYNNTLPYKHYDKNNDKYLVVLYKADEPLLDVGITSGNETEGTEVAASDTLKSTPLAVVNGEKRYNINVTTSGDILITLGGLLLQKDSDYTLSNGILEFAEPLFTDDIVNIIFIGKDNSSGIKNQEISVDNIITSGTTGNEGTNEVYYNTDTNKYEIYTDYRIKNPDSLIVFLRGSMLANKIDFYVSSSNPKRIILQGDVFVDDWLSVIYDSGENLDRAITEGYVDIAWYVTRPIKNTNGEFIVEFSLSDTFSLIEQSTQVPYVIDKLNYTSRVDLNYPYGTILYYRVRNVKKYNSLSGYELITENISDSIKIEIKTNISNNY